MTHEQSARIFPQFAQVVVIVESAEQTCSFGGNMKSAGSNLLI